MRYVHHLHAAGGDAPSKNLGRGGGILNEGTLALIGVNVISNKAVRGGGLDNRGTATAEFAAGSH